MEKSKKEKINKLFVSVLLVLLSLSSWSVIGAEEKKSITQEMGTGIVDLVESDHVVIDDSLYYLASNCSIKKAAGEKELVSTSLQKGMQVRFTINKEGKIDSVFVMERPKR